MGLVGRYGGMEILICCRKAGMVEAFFLQHMRCNAVEAEKIGCRGVSVNDMWRTQRYDTHAHAHEMK